MKNKKVLRFEKWLELLAALSCWNWGEPKREMSVHRQAMRYLVFIDVNI